MAPRTLPGLRRAAFAVLVAALAVIVLRKKKPGLNRPYLVWGYPVLPAVFSLAALAIVGQALVMGGILIAMRDLHRDIDSIHSSTRQKLDVLTQRVTDFIATSREPVHNVAANLAEITDLQNSEQHN